MWKFCVIGTLYAIASSASAAVIYLPVQYEYGFGQDKYYYGGSNPAVFARAERESQWLAITGSGSNSLVQTYSDLRPYLPSAAVYGFSANDARLAAYNSVPRYFRMSDVRLAANAETDAGSVAMQASPGAIEIKPYVRPAPIAGPRPVLTIPKTGATQPASVR